MDVSFYLLLQKFRVAFYAIDLETIVIYTLKIHETSIASEFQCNSIGSNHILGHSNQLSDVVKLFLLDGEKQHIKLSSK